MAAIAPPQARSIDLAQLRHGDTHPQRDFFDSRHFYSAYIAGVGAGKTILLVLDAFTFAKEYPGSIQYLTEPGSLQIKDTALEKIDGADGLFTSWRGKVYDRNEAGPQGGPVDIEFRNGSKLWLRAADTVSEERHRGPEVARLLMDEAPLGHQEAAFDTLTARCRQKGIPNQVKIAGTPKGRNWVWRRFSAHPMADSLLCTAHTAEAEEQGYLPRGYTDRLAAQYGGWDAPLARQELLASFIEMAGQVFPQFARDAHIRTLEVEAAALKNRLGGIDFGAVSPTAMIAGGLDAAGRGRAFAEWYKPEATTDQLLAVIGDWRQRYGIKRFICDPAGKKEIEAINRIHGEGTAYPARHGNSIDLRAGLVGSRLNIGPDKLPGMFIDPRCSWLITELEGLAWRRRKLQGKSEEELRDQFEPGCPDHAFDAWANIVSEWDTAAQPYQRPTGGPVNLYRR